MSVDEELGLVYLPTEMPTGDYYGGHRPGRQPVRRQPRRGRHQDRQAQVALPVHPATTSGTGTCPCAPILADVTIDGRLRKVVGAADQAGLGLRVRPRDRRAGVADRRAAGGAVRRAAEKSQPDAAVRHEAAGLRAAGRVDRRPDRLHAGAARRGGEAGVALQDRAALHAAGRQHVERPAGDADAAERHRRRQLAGRLLRPGDRASSTSSPTPQVSRARPGAGHGPSERRVGHARTCMGQASNPENPKANPVPTTVQGLPLIKPPYGRITAIDLQQGRARSGRSRTARRPTTSATTRR